MRTVNNPPLRNPSAAYVIVMVAGVVTMLNNAENRILVITMYISVLCLLVISERNPPIRDPKTLEMVKSVVIKPTWVTVISRLILMNSGAAKSMMPLFMEMRGKSIVNESVGFFLNSLITRFMFCTFCWMGGLFVISGKKSIAKVISPALRKAIGKLFCSAMNESTDDPIATPVKSPANIDPFNFPRSSFFVSIITHASIEMPRNAMPHCERNEMMMKRVRLIEGFIPPAMKSAKAQSIPPYIVYFLLFIFW